MDECRLLTLADGQGALLTSDGRLFGITEDSVLGVGPDDALLVHVDDTRGSALQAADVEKIKAVLGRALDTDRIVVASSDMSFEILRQDGAEEGSLDG